MKQSAQRHVQKSAGNPSPSCSQHGHVLMRRIHLSELSWPSEKKSTKQNTLRQKRQTERGWPPWVIKLSKTRTTTAPAFFSKSMLSPNFLYYQWSRGSLISVEKELATHSSVLAWRIRGTREPGGLPSMGRTQGWTRLKRLSSSSRTSPGCIS